jgi:hypothetical protein
MPSDTIKYTMLLDPDTDACVHRVMNNIIDLAGIRPRKGLRADVIRQTFALLDENPAILAQVAKRINATSEMATR